MPSRVVTTAAMLFFVALPSLAEAQQTLQYRWGSQVLDGGGSWVQNSPYRPGDTAQLFNVIPSAFAGFHLIQSQMDGNCLSRKINNQFVLQPCTNFHAQLFKFMLNPWSANMPPEMRVYPYVIQSGNECLRIETVAGVPGMLVASPWCYSGGDFWNETFTFGDGRSPIRL
ncbi:hypothetical protein POL68_22235 [Stigmatella sp. ncwal1]|uniref:Alpha-carbonic anhydrase domain-containing protein n=1 Tax=Stigmatella ashevillensis TaxID=2995309 RepID=A0ABT5DBZ9_9BACT|nr:hypothetical protein [Stigmatella ashevillena]MDC0711205.1 hypothetical protein [Stigmatella ashevillena]